MRVGKSMKKKHISHLTVSPSVSGHGYRPWLGAAGCAFLLMSQNAFSFFQDDVEGPVKIHKDKNFRVQNASAVLKEDTNYSNLANDPGMNMQNRVSSIQVEPGYWARVYNGTNFTGDSMWIGGNVPNLHDYSMGDSIESIKVKSSGPFHNSNKVAILYKSKGFKMSGSNYAELSNKNYSNLGTMGMADNVSSIRVKDGYWLRVYDKKNYGGSSIWIGKDNPNLHAFSNGMADDITSIKIQTSNPFANHPVTIYKDKSFRMGTYAHLNTGTYNDLDSNPGSNMRNRVSSIRVQEGYWAKVCKNQNLNGTCMWINSNVPDLNDYDMGDNIDSIKVTTNDPYDEYAVVGFKKANYLGEDNSSGRFKANGPTGDAAAKEYADLGNMHNEMSSIRVNEGYCAVLYSAKNSQGKSVTVCESVPNLRHLQEEIDWNNKPSSMKVIEMVDEASMDKSQIYLVGQSYDSGGYSKNDFINAVEDMTYEDPVTGELKNYTMATIEGAVDVANLAAGYCTVVYPSANSGDASADLGGLTCAVPLADGVTLSVTPVYGGCNADPGQTGVGASCEIGVFAASITVEMGPMETEFAVNGPTAGACAGVSAEMTCASVGADLVAASIGVTDPNGNGVGAGVSIGVGAGASAGYEDGVLSGSMDVALGPGFSVNYSIGVEENAKDIVRFGKAGYALVDDEIAAAGKQVLQNYKHMGNTYLDGAKLIGDKMLSIAPNGTVKAAEDVGGAITDLGDTIASANWKKADDVLGVFEDVGNEIGGWFDDAF